MVREGFIIKEIIIESNVNDAFDEVVHGWRKKTKQGRRLIAHRKKVVSTLIRQISDGSFKIIHYNEKIIYEYGKKRKLQISSMLKRIGVRAIMRVVDKHLHKRFIRTTSASIKRRGTHDLLHYICKDLDLDYNGTKYAYQYDISHFYESIVQKYALWCFERVFKDKTLISILKSLISLLVNGISFGLSSSQAAGNLLLSMNTDHYLKDQMGEKHAYRYCDDGLCFNRSKKSLWNVRNKIHDRLQMINLTIKRNERVYPVTEGINMLGYVIYSSSHIMLRKRIKQKFARKIKKVKSRKRRRELIASFYGMAKHACCRNLFYKLTGKEMKSFKDLNVAYKPEDGKKRFSGAVVSIRELVNLPIVVKDFETGIKTEQGEDRCIVSIDVNGEPKKFFTNSEEMKNILAQVSEMDDGFPFETTIKTETFGKGRTKYVFS